MQFVEDLLPLGGLLHQGVQRVCVAQVGLVALGAHCAIWAPSCVLANVASELSLQISHVGVVRILKGGPKVIAELLEACKAAGRWGIRPS